jgi:hypothetical protein
MRPRLHPRAHALRARSWWRPCSLARGGLGRILGEEAGERIWRDATAAARRRRGARALGAPQQARRFGEISRRVLEVLLCQLNCGCLAFLRGAPLHGRRAGLPVMLGNESGRRGNRIWERGGEWISGLPLSAGPTWVWPLRAGRNPRDDNHTMHIARPRVWPWPKTKSRSTTK